MTSPNNMQSLALNNSEKEHSRNSTSNTDDDDDDDEMPAITNAMYIAELEQRHVNLEQRYVNLEQQIANLQKQHCKHLTMLLVFFAVLVFIAFLVACVLNAKT